MVNKALLILFFFYFVSCNSRKQLCFENVNHIDTNFAISSIDTNCIYIQKYISNVNEVNSKFIKQENKLINENKPVIKFKNNGKIEFYYNKISFDEFKRPLYGNYRFYNDTIKVCREYYSAQSGTYYGISIFILKDSVLEEKSFPFDNGLLITYEKNCDKKK
ncbi:hypothetical protein [Flavobacterium sp.]|jgi:hypothetical protein|uniref:hypothetical protein n=1 Tax=Flavobacterium sp. TaxID=239 RepID=UPI0037BF1784